MIPEEAIRLRSFLIWEREGRPSAKAFEHWLRAKAELEAEYYADFSRPIDWRRNVMPRLPISRLPAKAISKRVPIVEPPAPRLSLPSNKGHLGR
jgi:hypothetical protein